MKRGRGKAVVLRRLRLPALPRRARCRWPCGCGTAAGRTRRFRGRCHPAGAGCGARAGRCGPHRRTHGLQLLDQRGAAATEAEAPALHGRVGARVQLQVDEAGIGFGTGHRAPRGHAMCVLCRRAGEGQAAIHVLADPGRGLLRQPGHQQRQRRGRAGQQVQRFGQVRARVIAQQVNLVAEVGAPTGEVAAEQRVFHRAVAAGHAHQQPVAAELLHGGGGLEGQQRLAEGQHHRGGAQQDVLGNAGQVAKVGEHFEHLRGIAEGRVVHRHVAHPQRPEAELVHQLGQGRMALHVRFAGQPAAVPAGKFTGGCPVVVQRCFDADAEAAGGEAGEGVGVGIGCVRGGGHGEIQ